VTVHLKQKKGNVPFACFYLINICYPSKCSENLFLHAKFSKKEQDLLSKNPFLLKHKSYPLQTEVIYTVQICKPTSCLLFLLKAFLDLQLQGEQN